MARILKDLLAPDLKLDYFVLQLPWEREASLLPFMKGREKGQMGWGWVKGEKSRTCTGSSSFSKVMPPSLSSVCCHATAQGGRSRGRASMFKMGVVKNTTT